MRAPEKAMDVGRMTLTVPTKTTKPEPKPVVFIVDDDISIRESLELLIDSAGWNAETFTCAQEFLARSRPNGPSCLLLDVSLPGLNGLDLQERIRSDRPEMPIIFISGQGDIPVTVRAMKAGAIEFLEKPYGEQAVLAAVRHALERSQATLSVRQKSQATRDAYASLTPRERDVMSLVVSGLLNKQVGGELGISEITVKTHRGNAMRKMNAKSLADLVNMAAELGVASPKRR
jgi:FixJ family two-component response regulator